MRLLFLLLPLITLPSKVGAATDVVCGSNSGGCSDCGNLDLSTKLFYANSGDTIQVCGDFNEESWLLTNLTITGVGSGAYFSISNENSFYIGAYWGGPTVTLESLHFSGHNRSSIIAENALITVNNCTFEDNDGWDGSAIQLETSTANIQNSTFSENYATYGGAIYMSESDLIIDASIFNENESDYGSALYAEYSTVTASNSTFSSNHSYTAGAAIFADNTDVSLQSVTANDNTSDEFGAVLALEESNLTATESRFISNSANLKGGAIITTGTSTITGNRNLWCDNSATNGGAIFGQEDAVLELENDVFSLNQASASGGAIYADHSTNYVTNNHFVGNTAGGDGSGSIFETKTPFFEFVNNLISDGPTSLIVTGNGSNPFSRVDYNHWFQSSYSFDSTIVAGVNNTGQNDPILVTPYPYVAADLPDCTASNFDLLSLRPQPGSPLIDAGDPDLCDISATLLGCTPPATGSARSDIGAFGGPSADQELITDTDGDGVLFIDDCDDTDPAVATSTSWYFDSDSDDHGDPNISTQSCNQPAHYVANNTDCDDNNSTITDVQTWYDDLDGDGYGDDATATDSCSPPNNDSVTVGNDCDDSKNTITLPDTWYYDSDNDSFGDPNVTAEACTQPVGYVANDLDCDDTDPTIKNTMTSWYQDADGDGYGDASVSILSCLGPAEYVLDDTDCDDNDALVHITQTWWADNDQDTFGDAADAILSCQQPYLYVDNDTDCDDTDSSVNQLSTWYEDNDQDGFGGGSTVTISCHPPTNSSVLNNNDCDDSDSDINPNTIWFEDADSDGYGSVTPTLIQCLQPAGYSDNKLDCAPDDPAINPDTLWYEDLDNDGFGNSQIYKIQCESIVGHTLDNTDCNDNSSIEYPGQTWYTDLDLDNYGDPAATKDCSPAHPSDVLNGDDCDDNDPDLNPDSIWYPDCDNDGYQGLDSVTQCEYPLTSVCGDGALSLGGWHDTPNPEDCDDYDSTQNPSTLWFLDSDQDEYGAGAIIAHIGCYSTYTGSDAIASNDLDCDDLEEDINPAGTETCNGEDDDCDGTVDNDASDAGRWQADCDGDGYQGLDYVTACVPTETLCDDGDAPDGGWTPATTNDNDCDDENALINPATQWFPDVDGDAYGDDSIPPILQCTSPGSDYSYSAGDCNDADPLTHPEADEICNGIDDNCDGTIDEDTAIDILTWHPDCDGDGYYAYVGKTSCEQPSRGCDGGTEPLGGWSDNLTDDADCDDHDPEEFPAQHWYLDDDQDTYGRLGDDLALIQCDRPSGYVSNSTDCDDTNPLVNPLAAEISSDGVDNNCDDFSAKAWLGGASCGCSSNQKPLQGWAFMLPVLWLLRRRKPKLHASMG